MWSLKYLYLPGNNIQIPYKAKIKGYASIDEYQWVWIYDDDAHYMHSMCKICFPSNYLFIQNSSVLFDGN